MALTIGEVSRDSGVPASTLRYWESVGLLEQPGRVGGKRRYDPQILRRISLIVLIKRVGFTLTQTKVLLGGLSERTPPPVIWRELARRKLPEIKRTLAEASAIEQILQAGVRCDCLTVDDCMRRVDVALAHLTA
ncbi:MAG TPA: MerR family transcriptional regulator [Solirubrobacteraceae bacterium]|jgi:MerR family redox-sensitive transcriptional activator SoxR